MFFESSTCTDAGPRHRVRAKFKRKKPLYYKLHIEGTNLLGELGQGFLQTNYKEAGSGKGNEVQHILSQKGFSSSCVPNPSAPRGYWHSWQR